MSMGLQLGLQGVDFNLHMIGTIQYELSLMLRTEFNISVGAAMSQNLLLL